MQHLVTGVNITKMALDMSFPKMIQEHPMISKIVDTIHMDQVYGTNALKRVESLKLVSLQDVWQRKHIQHNVKKVLLKNAIKIKRMINNAGVWMVTLNWIQQCVVIVQVVVKTITVTLGIWMNTLRHVVTLVF